MSTYPLENSVNEFHRLTVQGNLYRWITKEFLDGVLDQIHPRRVLDAGCGVGMVSRELVRKLGKNAEIVAIDTNPDAIQYAKQYASHHGLEQVDFRCGDWIEEACTGQYDLIVGRCLLIYLDHPQESLQRLFASLKPGTVIAFQEPDHRSHMRTTPESPLFQEYALAIENAAKENGIQVSLGLRLDEIVKKVGFEPISYHSAGRVDSGPKSHIFELLAHTVWNMRGAKERIASLPPSVEDLTKLLQREAIQNSLQVNSSVLIGIGAQVPSNPRSPACNAENNGLLPTSNEG